MSVLIVIPARGGSKGIPRKNLRSLCGKPLLYYSINTALGCCREADVVVDSDDEEILMMASKLGAEVNRRPERLSGDAVTLDPVIYNAYVEMKERTGRDYDIIVTMQPTSPLLKASSLEMGIRMLKESPDLETVLSVTEERKLSWRKEGDKFLPNYEKRVNRQQLPSEFKETGGFFITKSSVITEKSRIGKNVSVVPLEGKEAIDIDTYEDWALCEYYLRHKTVLIVVSGYREIGLGHVYRQLQIASNILDHRLVFLVDKKSALGMEVIASYNYDVRMQSCEDIAEDIAKLSPDAVISDILDTTEDYMGKLARMGVSTINFEDLGSGAEMANAVINALYPERKVLKNHYFGHEYFCPRDEFLFTPDKMIEEDVKRVLLSFGGVDPSNLTEKVLDSIYDFCVDNRIAVDVVLGLGYEVGHDLSRFEKANIYRNIKNMSEFMFNADIVFTSAGRTVYEIACIGTPAIIMAQNEREMTHFFANAQNGFINMGLGVNVTSEHILETFAELVDDFDERKYMNELMLSRDIRKGRERVISIIREVITG
ncbi:cytidylyltransferase domain-containing protein [Limisalsivibrio acetivorans]|uniref:cytidylyltransferase domain-containing protein n=1 Tax=Limisalsivibrio acetivorans TaxID=1304888 RepID=UPI0003B4A676|nr:acylneuraminate cytidylyltransferase [Limisalsivibrio acetivorans]